ncbi:MAG: alpha-galactosidase [Clostridia bacterium]|nr:alpha-galactosidase [Clostridia bacterium]
MAVSYNKESRIFTLETETFSYSMIITAEDRLITLYYGTKLAESDLPDIKSIISRRSLGRNQREADYEEFHGQSPYGGNCEPTMEVRFADGTRDADLFYRRYAIEDNTLRIFLADKYKPLEVELIYRVYEDCDIIEKNAVLRNNGSDPIKFDTIFSGLCHLPVRENYRLTTLTGQWADEYRITRAPVRDGQTVLQTRNGLSGPDAVPLVILDEGDADERRGDAWYMTLLWSGNHKMIVERTVFGNVQVTAGLNNWDFCLDLEGRKSFETPVLAIGFTEGGFGQVSRNIHAYSRKHLMREIEARRIMPVVYNPFGTFFGNINEEKIMSVIDIAHEIGVEALILDAGWQGEGENYRLGMGIWNENKERFPKGLKFISDELHRRGMMFGLWMEPECCHVDSPLAKEHPEWILRTHCKDDGRFDNRFVLNFALPEVKKYIFDKTCYLIENCGVDYFKVDFNRLLWDVGTKSLPEKDRQMVRYYYTKNLCDYFDEIKNKYPKLMFENCAGGGQRVDLGMLRFTGRINRSDNQDPYDVLRIHEGFSNIMLPKLAGGGCHISSVYTAHHNDRVSTMKFQARVAMMGALAVGQHLINLTADEKEELKDYIAQYKSIRHIVHLGDIYRLASVNERPYAAYQYLSEDRSEGVLFIFGRGISAMRIYERLRLDGLDEDAIYEFEELGAIEKDSISAGGDAKINTPQQKPRTGKALMRLGIDFVLRGDMDSIIYRFKKL